MYMIILNEEQRAMFNKIYEIKSDIVFIKKSNNNFYVKIDISNWFKLNGNIAKYFI